ncbi:RidA family protein [Nocardioides sp. BGMRC 2183]|nr:RidA family protein [Nocardioides sp. BGMRC 2183]
MTATPEQRLADLGLTVPDVVPPVATYLPAVRTGDHVYTAGQLPMRDGALITTGKVGEGVTAEEAVECARQCALNAIAAIRSQVTDLSRVRIVKVVAFVASASDFTGQPGVANGASELFGAVFGDQGVHARSAVGVPVLPLDAPVEVEVIAEILPAGGERTENGA